MLYGLMALTGSSDIAAPTAAIDGTNSQPVPLDESDKVRLQVERAFAICDSLNKSGAGTAPCEVGSASITIYTNSSVAQARMLCSEAVRASGAMFDGRWTMYIKGPYTGEQSLAYCRLP